MISFKEDYIIDYLANYPEFIPDIAKLLYREWSHLVPDQTIFDIEESIKKRCRIDILPLALVAVIQNPNTKEEQWIGTITIKEKDLETRKDLSPWLAGLYVKKEYRGRGIAKELIQKLLVISKEMGIPELYLYTETAEKYYSKLGWRLLERSEDLHGNSVSVMKFILK